MINIYKIFKLKQLWKVSKIEYNKLKVAPKKLFHCKRNLKNRMHKIIK